MLDTRVQINERYILIVINIRQFFIAFIHLFTYYY